MLRHTEDWETSQPPHLKHLAIVRDSTSIGRSQHILFLTFENFEKLVQQGLTSWEAVKSKANGKKKSKDSQKSAAKMHIAHSLEKIDQYGFADIQMSVLGDKDGRGTLSENSSSAVMDFVSASVNDPIPYQENGKWSKSLFESCKYYAEDSIGVRYPTMHGNKKLSKENLPPTRPVRDPNLPAKPMGRPRKYAKGEELYKPEVRARLAAEGRLPSKALHLYNSSYKKRGRPSGSSKKPLELIPSKQTSSEHILPEQVQPEPSATTSLHKTRDSRISSLSEDAHLPLDQPLEYETLASSSTEIEMEPLVASRELPSAIQISEKLPAMASIEKKRPPRKRKRRELDVDGDGFDRGILMPEARVEKRQSIRPIQAKGPESASYLSERASPLLANGNAPEVSVPSPRFIDTPNPLNSSSTLETGQTPTVDRVVNHNNVLGHANFQPFTVFSSVPISQPKDKQLPEIEVETESQHNGKISNGKLPSHRGGTTHFLRKKTMLEIIDEHDGVFPGERDLYIVWALRWRNVNSDKSMADMKTYKTVEKTLTVSGELKVFKFSFRTSKGQQITRTILARAHVMPNSPQVKALEKKMVEAESGTSIPAELGISDYHRRVVLNKQLPALKLGQDSESKVIRHQPLATERRRDEAIARRPTKNQNRGIPNTRSRIEAELSDEEDIETNRARSEVFNYLDTNANRKRLTGPRRKEWLEQLQSMHSSTLGDSIDDSSEDDPPVQIKSGLAELSVALNAPEQRFHSRSGTFGTFLYSLRAYSESSKRVSTSSKVHSLSGTRPARSIEGTADALVDPRKSAPASLHEILDRVSSARSSAIIGDDTESSVKKFFQEIDQVESWENQSAQPIKSQDLSCRFINHAPPSMQRRPTPKESKDRNFVDFATYGPSELYTPSFVHAVAVLETSKLKSQRGKERIRNSVGRPRKSPVEPPTPRNTVTSRDTLPLTATGAQQDVGALSQTRTLRSGTSRSKYGDVLDPLPTIPTPKLKPKSRLIQPTKWFKTRRLTSREEAPHFLASPSAGGGPGTNTRVFYENGIPVARKSCTKHPGCN